MGDDDFSYDDGSDSFTDGDGGVYTYDDGSDGYVNEDTGIGYDPDTNEFYDVATNEIIGGPDDGGSDDNSTDSPAPTDDSIGPIDTDSADLSGADNAIINGSYLGTDANGNSVYTAGDGTYYAVDADGNLVAVTTDNPTTSGAPGAGSTGSGSGGSPGGGSPGGSSGSSGGGSLGSASPSQSNTQTQQLQQELNSLLQALAASQNGTGTPLSASTQAQLQARINQLQAQLAAGGTGTTGITSLLSGNNGLLIAGGIALVLVAGLASRGSRQPASEPQKQAA